MMSWAGDDLPGKVASTPARGSKWLRAYRVLVITLPSRIVLTTGWHARPWFESMARSLGGMPRFTEYGFTVEQFVDRHLVAAVKEARRGG